jgi:beta-lactamase class A
MSRRADAGIPDEFAVRSALGVLGDLRGCRVGVCAAGLEGPLAGVGFGFGEDEVFPSASLIKVLVLAELLRQADSGSLSLADEVLVGFGDLVEDSEMLEARELPAPVSCRDLAEGMITVSDNAATNLLIRRVGAGNVNALADGIWLRRTALRREMMDFGARSRGEENTTSASDMVALMREIWAGSTLTNGSKDLALRFLSDQRLSSKVRVPSLPGARYAHKTGELEGVENDAGIFLVPGRSFALAVLVEGNVEGAEAPVAEAPVAEALRALCGFYAGTDGG